MSFADPMSAASGANGVMLSAAMPLLGALAGAGKLYLGAKRATEEAPGEQARQKQHSVIALVMMGACVVLGFGGAFVISKSLTKDPQLVPGNAAYAAGLVNGLSACFSAAGLGFLASTAVRCGSQQPRLLVANLLIAIFIEAFALYGLIVACEIVAQAIRKQVDLVPDAVVPFATADILANLGGVVGSVTAGIAILEVGVEQPHLVMRCMIPVVMSGVTGIYGLLTSVIDTNPFPPSGSGCAVGVLYLISGAGLSYVGYHGVKGVAERPSTFNTMVSRLIACQSIGLAGLIYSLLAHAASSKQMGHGAAESARFAPVDFLGEGLAGSGPVAALALPLIFVPLLVAFLLGAWQPQSVLEAPLLV
mmetsp:Transcript_129374/g.360343  ORF Transcript_129374/g.360343 Transcript_129374/m.360343 type:complete len:363 (-) Transcript_129374:150-1238(-)